MVVKIKAQVSLEMLIYISIIMLILAIFIFITAGQNRAIFIERVNLDAKRVGTLVSVEINTALGVGDGYYHKFFLPTVLYGSTDYIVTIIPSEQRVYVTWDGGEYSSSVLTSNIVSGVKKGFNEIRNIYGMIKIE